jgi:hypothetical protein
MRIRAKPGESPAAEKKSAAAKKPTTRPEGSITENSHSLGLGSLSVQRTHVAELATFRDLRELFDRLGKHAANEDARSYSSIVVQSLGRLAPYLDYVQSFVPRQSPGPGEAALSIIEYAALENVSALIHNIEVACLAGLQFGYELAGDPWSKKKVKEFQRAQAERARKARARISAASPEERALKALIEEHLPRPSGRDFKDAHSILDSVNKDLVNRGFPEVKVDKIRRRIKNSRGL